MVVIVAVAAMQVAGGLDYLVAVADRVLRKDPKKLAIMAPLVTYLLTFMASTGQVSFATFPVIVEVAKENDVRPQRALSVAVVASQLAITASPISAAVLFLSTLLEKENTGWDYLDLLAVSIPSTFLAVMATSMIFLAWDKARHQTRLADCPEYQRRLAAGEIKPPVRTQTPSTSGGGVTSGTALATRPERQTTSTLSAADLRPGARRSVIIFLVALGVVLTYAIAISDKVGLIADPAMTGAQARLATMLTAALAIVVFCKPDVAKIPSASTFKAGMNACVCILGVAWLGTTS